LRASAAAVGSTFIDNALRVAMRQRIDVDRLYEAAQEQVAVADYDGRPPLPFPPACPFTLEQLLNPHAQALQAMLASG
jgi:hypothetical protein